MSDLLEARRAARDAISDLRWKPTDVSSEDLANAALEAVVRAGYLILTKAEVGSARWQPIESAPKDGTEILACEHEPKYGTTRGWAVVFWHREDGAKDWSDGQWHISDGRNDPIWYRNWPYLTHWQPLPSPPAPRASE